jgi:hypothetical protein
MTKTWKAPSRPKKKTLGETLLGLRFSKIQERLRLLFKLRCGAFDFFGLDGDCLACLHVDTFVYLSETSSAKLRLQLEASICDFRWRLLLTFII